MNRCRVLLKSGATKTYEKCYKVLYRSGQVHVYWDNGKHVYFNIEDIDEVVVDEDA